MSRHITVEAFLIHTTWQKWNNMCLFNWNLYFSHLFPIAQTHPLACLGWLVYVYDWFLPSIPPKKVCMYLFRYAAYKDILQMLETQYFLFLPHPNQNSLDFPCFELTAKMTSFCKKLRVNSGKTSTVFTFIPEPITKSLRKLPVAWPLRCDGIGSLL